MPDYSHRDVVDKLGIKPGYAVAFVDLAGVFPVELRDSVLERAGRSVASSGEVIDVVLVLCDASTPATEVLAAWKQRIKQNGAIWLLTPKRGLAGYINQNDLIPAGIAAGLVDNKTCSVSDTLSGMRFVIRLSDRTTPRA